MMAYPSRVAGDRERECRGGMQVDGSGELFQMRRHGASGVGRAEWSGRGLETKISRRIMQIVTRCLKSHEQQVQEVKLVAGGRAGRRFGRVCLWSNRPESSCRD